MRIEGRALLIGALLGLAYFFIWKPGRDFAAKPGVVIPKERISSSKKKSNAARDSHRALDQQREEHNRRLMLGLRPLPVKQHKQNFELSIQTAPEPRWCRSGDLDLLKTVTRNLRSREFTLSIESLGPKTIRESQGLSLAELSQGKTVRMLTKIPKEATALGLFLCSDPGQTGSCQGRAAIDRSVWKLPPDALERKVRDRIVYFQYLVSDQAGMYLVSSQNWSRAQFDTLQRRLKDNLGVKTSDMEGVRQLVGSIQPMPARLHGPSLAIPLPYNDPRCLSLR